MKRTGVLCWLLALSALTGCDKLGLGKKDPSADDSGKAASSATASASVELAPLPPPVSGMVHVIDECKIVVRLDAQKFLANPLVQKDVISALRSNWKFQLAISSFGLDLKQSFTDVVFCVTDPSDSEHGFAFIFGGSIRPDTLVPAFKKDDASTKVETIGGRQVAMNSGLAFGQAGDGVLIASQPGVFEKLANAHNLTSKIDTSKDLALAVRDDFITSQADSLKEIPELVGVHGVSGFVDLTALKIEFTATLSSADAARKVETRIKTMKDEALKEPSANTFGEVEMLRGGTVKVAGAVVTISAPIPPGTPAKLTALMADAIKNAK